jgi:hypothetical protein
MLDSADRQQLDSAFQDLLKQLAESDCAMTRQELYCGSVSRFAIFVVRGDGTETTVETLDKLIDSYDAEAEIKTA